MVLAPIDFCNKYVNLHPHFELAFNEIKRIANQEWIEETSIIIDDELFIITSDNSPKGTDAKLEFHRKYIDIQFVLEGEDSIGWKNLENCSESLKEYNEEKDFGLFDDNATSVVVLPSNNFAIFFPEDAHAPLAGNQVCKKIIAKVRVQ